jgi:outer membrane lipoprotein-sorting protein
MKSFTKITISAITLMFLFSSIAVVETNAQAGPLNEILKRMEAHRNALTSLKANVKMVKYNPQLDEKDTTEGNLSYVPADGRDAYIRIDWTKPNEEVLAVKNREYILYTKRLKQAIVGKASEAKGNGKNNLFAFVNMSKSELKANYSIKNLGEEIVDGKISAWHLELTPKTASSFSTADIWVDGNGMPIQVKATEKNRDTTTVYLSALQKNVDINAAVFNFKPPKGTKIING